MKVRELRVLLKDPFYELHLPKKEGSDEYALHSKEKLDQDGKEKLINKINKDYSPCVVNFYRDGELIETVELLNTAK